MSSRLDLPSTRSTVASAIPVTHASSSRYSPSQLLTPHLPATPAPKTFTGCHSFDRRNLFPRPLSAPRSATTLFISKVYRFGSLLWVSEKICWVSTTCSDEHPSPPFDVPVSSPPISNFGVSLKYSPSPVKRMVVSNPRSFKISDGFIRVFVMRLLLYLSFMKIVSVDTPCLLTASTSSSTEKSTLQPCLLSMKGDVFSGLLPRLCFSLLTGLLSCGAVCTGPEDAIENNLIVFVGEGCLLTSPCVIILQLSDFVRNAFLTHSSFVLNSLSPSLEDLSDLIKIDNGPTKQPWIGLLDCGWFSYVSCTSLSLMDALGSAEDPVLQVPSMAELNYTQGACAVSSIASGWISATTPNGGRTNNLCHSYGLS
ncbi:hypothetical protein Bca101_077231 [Brassica carinata]